jgi:hypothetical protein
MRNRRRMAMSELERLAIKLHDFLWENMGVSAEWPLELGGDEEVVEEVIVLLNGIQDAIVASGYGRRKYSGRMP